VELIAVSRLPTKWGLFRAYCYQSKLDGTEHIAVVKVCNANSAASPFVRMFVQIVLKMHVSVVRPGYMQTRRLSVLLISGGSHSSTVANVCRVTSATERTSW
jgi:GTP cyclohydrolase II